MCWYSLKWNSGWIIQSVVTIFYEGSSMQIFFELTSFSWSVFCSFRLLSLFLLRKTFLSSVHFVAISLQKKRNFQSPLFLDTYPGGSPSSRVKITRDVCVRGGGVGGKGPLGAIPLSTGNWEGICESYLRAICWHLKLFQFPLTIRHQDIDLSTWAIDLDSLLKVGHYGHYNRWSVFPNLS